MAVGDLFWFDVATKIGFPDSSAFSSGDDIRCALTTTAGVTSTSTGGFGTFTEASTGTYTSSGFQLEAWGDMWTQSGKVATFDTTTNPTWAQHASHSTSVTYAMLINITETGKRPLCAVDLGDVDMTAGDLTINNQSLH